ncbi:MAG: hypothetical protein ACREV0_12455 [Burkholderiales bacterium]
MSAAIAVGAGRERGADQRPRAQSANTRDHERLIDSPNFFFDVITKPVIGVSRAMLIPLWETATILVQLG